MAVTDILERATSRPLVVDPKAMSGVYEYWVRSDDLADDSDVINNAVALASPNVWLGMVKKNIKSTPQGGGFWYASVNYGQMEGAELGGQDGTQETATADDPSPHSDQKYLGPEISFTTTGGTQHITRSIATRCSAWRNVGAAPPDHARAIGVDGSGNVAGVDVPAPQFSWSITRRIEYVTMPYLRALKKCMGRTNKLAWRGWEADELRFMGAEGKFAGDLITDFSWLITFKFDAGDNELNLEITDGLVVQEKRAWDYLWVGFADTLDPATQKMVSKPTYAYVEQVAHQADFWQTFGFK